MRETGKRLKKLREDMGLTQTQMADILGLKQPSINKYEHGTATPTVESLRKYADYFDVSMDYIFARIDNPKGELYGNDSKSSETNDETQRMIEKCFDPSSPFHMRLKQMLLEMMKESEKE